MTTAKVVILIFFVCCGLPQKTTSDDEASSAFSRNDRNISTDCLLKIDQSALKNIFKIIRHREKNAIGLNVWMLSANNTLNKTWFLPEIRWANDMGRTLITLIAQAEKQTTNVRYTRTLTSGVEEVEIVISEEPEGCLLLSGNSTLDNVFYFLWRQLYQYSGDDTDYQLCIKQNTIETKTFKGKYNCCGILNRGLESIPICEDYSTVQVEIIYYGLFFGEIIFFFGIFLPLVLDHLSKKETIQYKISDSPMSLSSILHTIFFEGHGPIKTLCRKLFVTVLVFVTTCWPIWNPDNPARMTLLCAVLSSWALLLFFVDLVISAKMPKEVDPELNLRELNPMKILAVPFNLKNWRNVVNKLPFFHKLFKLHLKSATSFQQSLTNPEASTERTSLLRQEGFPQVQQQQINNSQQGTSRRIDLCKYCLSFVVLIILYLIVLPYLCLIALLMLHYGRSTYITRSGSHAAAALGIMTAVITLLSCFFSFDFSFYFIAGLNLNGGFYSPYFVPLFIILFYSWINWKSTVEAKYMQLNANIYKVCKKCIPDEESGDSSYHDIDTNDTRSSNDSNTPTSNSVTLFKIKLDGNGEPIIPKKLYDIIRETFLPYDEILFPYFTGVLLVVFFAYFVYILMSMALTSGVSSNVQIISTAVVTLFPFIFDVVWEKKSEEQKAANLLALKSKLKHVLSVHSTNSVTGEISVEFTGAMPIATLDEILR